MVVVAFYFYVLQEAQGDVWDAKQYAMHLHGINYKLEKEFLALFGLKITFTWKSKFNKNPDTQYWMVLDWWLMNKIQGVVKWKRYVC